MLRCKDKYSIGEVAKISGLSIKTLRYYDNKGILSPALRNDGNHYRYYSESQILEVLAIREMRQRGLSLEDIQYILNSDSMDIITEYYETRIASINEEIRNLERQLHLAENSRNMILMAISDVKQAPSATASKKQEEHAVTVEMVKNMSCLYSRHRSRIFVEEVFWDRFAEIYQMMDKKGYMASGPITAVFHEHYTHQFLFEEGDLEILQPVSNADPQDPDVKNFGGFLLASLIHVGFYTELLPKYVALIKWIEENGYVIDGNPLEFYLVEFTQGVNRNEYVTRVGFPVKAREAR